MTLLRTTWTVADRPVSDDLACRVVAAALEHGGRAGLAVDLIFVDDATLSELHGRFLDDPSATDVMAFDLGPAEGAELPGERDAEAEIYVSVDCARRVAQERGHPIEAELCLYLVHGALHLCGFDDHDPADAAAMRAAEVHVLGWSASSSRRLPPANREPE